jgi:hypothetical protein
MAMSLACPDVDCTLQPQQLDAPAWVESLGITQVGR